MTIAIWKIRMTVATIPQIRPALVKSRPLESMDPAVISFKSLLPMTHAATPKNGQRTKPKIPKRE